MSCFHALHTFVVTCKWYTTPGHSQPIFFLEACILGHVIGAVLPGCLEDYCFQCISGCPVNHFFFHLVVLQLRQGNASGFVEADSSVNAIVQQTLLSSNSSSLGRIQRMNRRLCSISSRFYIFLFFPWR
jgi:hypothetical protein